MAEDEKTEQAGEETVAETPRHETRQDSPGRMSTFDITVPEEELEGVRTVGQAFELVTGKLS